MPARPVSDAAWEALPLPAMELDSSGGVQRANEAFRALGPDAAEGRRWLETLTAAMQARLRARLAAQRDFALELQQGNGSTAWFELSARWLEGAQRYTCVLRDATAERLAERDARAEAQRFSLLADSVPALIAYYEAGAPELRLRQQAVRQGLRPRPGVDRRPHLCRGGGAAGGRRDPAARRSAAAAQRSRLLRAQDGRARRRAALDRGAAWCRTWTTACWWARSC